MCITIQQNVTLVHHTNNACNMTPSR